MINKAALIILLGLSPLCFAKSQSFQLYSQGKILESVVALKKELRGEKFNSLVLNSQFKRLTSAYKNHLGVSDNEMLETLKLMVATQPALKDMEYDVPAFIKELIALTESKPSLAQVETYLNSTISRDKNLSKIYVAKLFAGRKIKSTHGAERAQWTYLSGRAGFFHFNSGNAELKLYLQMCERLGKVPACNQVKEAHSMLHLGKSIESPANEN